MKNFFIIPTVVFFIGFVNQTVNVRQLESSLAILEKTVQSSRDEIVSKQISLNSCNNVLDAMSSDIRYFEHQNNYLIGRNEPITNRLKQTTDILESVSRCAYYGKSIKSCLGRLDIGKFLEQNRKLNF